MRWPTHALLGGVATAIPSAVLALLGGDKDLFSAGVLCGVLGALAPDIDTPHSLVGRRMRPLSFFLKHRGFFHSRFFCFLLFILAFSLFVVSYVAGALAVCFAVGYASHIFADSWTIAGIEGKKGPIRTGSLMEAGLFILLLAVAFVLFVVLSLVLK